jgi:hypothetical protein
VLAHRRGPSERTEQRNNGSVAESVGGRFAVAGPQKQNWRF